MARMELTIHGQNGKLSRIVFGPLAEIGDAEDLGKAVLVTDRLISRIHGAVFPACPVIEAPRGEAAKSLATLEALYGRFLDLGLGRDGLVFAVGGGTISDLAGFAASTWLRGVDFGFAPTTLLAMVDASVGGKNGLDFRGVKNLVGTFSLPRFVRMDVSLLASLSDVEFASGMAEAVKHAVIAGGRYFALIESTAGASDSADSAREPRSRDVHAERPAAEALELIVAGSVEIKAGIVERDERESRERRKLNLGHTVGHGIETATGLPHGHCVAAGLGTACRLAESLGRLDGAELARITRLLAAWGLPSSIGEALALASSIGSRKALDGPELRSAIATAISADKKRLGADILMAIPEAIGSVLIEAIPLADLQAFVMEAP
jgi:3-dehydroquinate synthase